MRARLYAHGNETDLHSIIANKYGCHIDILYLQVSAILMAFRPAYQPIMFDDFHQHTNLKLRREKLALQYSLKTAAHPDNPTYSSVCDPKLEHLYKIKEKTIPSFGLRIRPILQKIGIQQDLAIKESTPNNSRKHM